MSGTPLWYSRLGSVSLSADVRGPLCHFGLSVARFRFRNTRLLLKDRSLQIARIDLKDHLTLYYRVAFS